MHAVVRKINFKLHPALTTCHTGLSSASEAGVLMARPVHWECREKMRNWNSLLVETYTSLRCSTWRSHAALLQWHKCWRHFNPFLSDPPLSLNTDYFSYLLHTSHAMQRYVTAPFQGGSGIVSLLVIKVCRRLYTRDMMWVKVQEGPTTQTESWNNREHVRSQSTNITPTLSRFNWNYKAGAFIMWILVIEIPLRVSEIPLPVSEISFLVSGIPLTLSEISLTHYPMCVVHGQWQHTWGKWDSTSPK